MGMSFVTAHFYNAQNLTKAQFKKALADMMKAKGFAETDEDNAALTYTFAFAPDGKWITFIADTDETIRETAGLAKALEMPAVKIELVDSDFAELVIYDKAGARTDTLTLGDSYLGEDAPMGEPAAWEPFLCGDGAGAWDKVREIQDDSYGFVEDALRQFAPLIGMDERTVLLNENSETNEKNTLVMHFADSSKEKKITLKEAFFKVFGEVLEPLGFSRLKGIPGFARIVEPAAVQVIRLEKEKYPGFTAGEFPEYDPFKDKLEQFEVYISAFPVFSEDIDWLLSKKEVCSCYEDTRTIYHKHNTDPDKPYLKTLAYYNETTMFEALDRALMVVRDYVMPIFNGMTSYQSLIDYDESTIRPVDREPLYYFLDDLRGYVDKRIERSIKDLEVRTVFNRDLTPEIIIERSNAFYDKLMRLKNELKNDTGKFNEFIAKIESQKQQNLEYLKKLGVAVPDNDKP